MNDPTAATIKWILPDLNGITATTDSSDTELVVLWRGGATITGTIRDLCDRLSWTRADGDDPDAIVGLYLRSGPDLHRIFAWSVDYGRDELTADERGGYAEVTLTQMGRTVALGRYPIGGTSCPAPCPPECTSCIRDRDCECYEHQDLADRWEDPA